MNKTELQKLKYEDLKEIAKTMDIKIPKTKDELIEKMLKCFNEYEKYKKEKVDKYQKIEQLGEKGKEGITYLVKDKKGNEYAMKTFKKNKSSDKIRYEAKLQQMAYKEGVSPEIIEIDTFSKYIIMEKMDNHLLDIMKKQNGNLTQIQQKQIIKIFKGLDNAKVFHGDSNLLNYMYKNKKIYIIDFGMSKEIDEKLIKKLNTETPNIDIMTLGFILKLKEFNCPKTSYSYLIKFLKDEDIKTFNINI
jgi:tRNA A-37 threonylcarbamoyl transferase component Bud32